ncbi:carbon-nitrogen hydrolase family protein [Kribbella sp. NPDC050124]|uniref:carbon-nitrogen hydrolase family protein n=1 Tax=Kribbella sp. NPDC050124 TaxID=3364114 RepID=UPI0037AD6A92
MQLNSTEDKARNLRTADRLTRAAVSDGAQLVVLPEKFNVLGTDDEVRRGAEKLEQGPTIGWARATARELGIDLVLGSIAERREGRQKLSNTSIHVGPSGAVMAVYRKIHLFDVAVSGTEYRESDAQEPGGEIVLTETGDGVPLGMSICYDLRFPELYRILAVRGARVLLVPAAFTSITGQAHWDILCRARAIENQTFVVAADQVGRHRPGNESFGGSLIVDPWGDVLARASDGECFIAADLDLARQDSIRGKLPSLANRMPATYIWPSQEPADQ